MHNFVIITSILLSSCFISYSQSEMDNMYFLLGMMSQDDTRSDRPDDSMKLIHFFSDQKEVSKVFIERLSILDEEMNFGYQVHVDENGWTVINSKKWKNYFDSNFFCLKKDKDSWVEDRKGLEYPLYTARLKSSRIKTKPQKYSFLLGVFILKGHFNEDGNGVILGLGKNYRKGVISSLKELNFKSIKNDKPKSPSGIYANRLAFIPDTNFSKTVDKFLK